MRFRSLSTRPAWLQKGRATVPDEFRELASVANSGRTVPFYSIGTGRKAVEFKNPIMLSSINECGYWAVVCDDLRLWDRGDTLVEAMDLLANSIRDDIISYHDGEYDGSKLGEAFAYHLGDARWPTNRTRSRR